MRWKNLKCINSSWLLKCYLWRKVILATFYEKPIFIRNKKSKKYLLSQNSILFLIRYKPK